MHQHQFQLHQSDICPPKQVVLDLLALQLQGT
uniref:Uncharacterized protein n=1 Tax=Arundo donax TaxID=35708 RepID=A0A0A9H1Z1_ARUDO